jgi:flagellar biosynthesis anti-sigma factor FlgM
MKVNEQIGNNSAYGVGKTQETEAAQQSGRSRQPKSGGSVGADSADISSTAGVLQSDASARASKVEELTDAVQSGSYQVDSAAVSRRMVDETLGHKD